MYQEYNIYWSILKIEKKKFAFAFIALVVVSLCSVGIVAATHYWHGHRYVPNLGDTVVIEVWYDSSLGGLPGVTFDEAKWEIAYGAYMWDEPAEKLIIGITNREWNNVYAATLDVGVLAQASMYHDWYWWWFNWVMRDPGQEMWFNDRCTWSTDGAGGYDIRSVAVHESGHWLDFLHTDDANTVMYPYYRFYRSLYPHDIDTITQIYG